MVRIVGGNAYFIFQRFLPKLCTVAHWPAPVGHPIAIDEMARIDQHNLAAHITCLSFWKQRCFYFFDLPKKRSDDPSRSMAFRYIWSSFLEGHCIACFLLQTPTTNFGITWSWIFPVLHCKSGDSKDKQSTSIEKKRWKVEWTYRPGAVHRRRDRTENVRRPSPWKLRVACSYQTSEKGNKTVTVRLNERSTSSEKVKVLLSRLEVVSSSYPFTVFVQAWGSIVMHRTRPVSLHLQ